MKVNKYVQAMKAWRMRRVVRTCCRTRKRETCSGSFTKKADCHNSKIAVVNVGHDATEVPSLSAQLGITFRTCLVGLVMFGTRLDVLAAAERRLMQGDFWLCSQCVQPLSESLYLDPTSIRF